MEFCVEIISVTICKCNKCFAQSFEKYVAKCLCNMRFRLKALFGTIFEFKGIWCLAHYLELFDNFLILIINNILAEIYKKTGKTSQSDK